MLLEDVEPLSEDAVIELALHAAQIWKSVQRPHPTLRWPASLLQRRPAPDAAVLSRLIGHASWAVVAAVAAEPRTPPQAHDEITDRAVGAMFGPDAINDAATFAECSQDMEHALAASGEHSEERIYEAFASLDPAVIEAGSNRMQRMSSQIVADAFPQAVAEFVADGRLDASNADAAIVALNATVSQAWDNVNTELNDVAARIKETE